MNINLNKKKFSNAYFNPYQSTQKVLHRAANNWLKNWRKMNYYLIADYATNNMSFFKEVIFVLNAVQLLNKWPSWKHLWPTMLLKTQLKTELKMQIAICVGKCNILKKTSKRTKRHIVQKLEELKTYGSFLY